MTKRTVFRARKTTAKNKNGAVIECMADNYGKLFDPKSRQYLTDDWTEKRSIKRAAFSFIKFSALILIVVFAFFSLAPLSNQEISWLLLFSIPIFAIICTVAITLLYFHKKKNW